jgi:hypothetical protein
MLHYCQPKNSGFQKLASVADISRSRHQENQRRLVTSHDLEPLQCVFVALEPPSICQQPAYPLDLS